MNVQKEVSHDVNILNNRHICSVFPANKGEIATYISDFQKKLKHSRFSKQKSCSTATNSSRGILYQDSVTQNQQSSQ